MIHAKVFLNDAFYLTRPSTEKANNDKENLNTPKKRQPAARSESYLTPINPNALDFDSVRSGTSTLSHGIDTQDLKITLSGQPRNREQDHDSISSFGKTSQTMLTLSVGDEDVVMESQPSQRTRSQVAKAMKTRTTLVAEDQVMASTIVETETQLEDLDPIPEAPTQIQFDTQMTDRDDDAVCVCQSKVGFRLDPLDSC